jgi:hypothetical protein
MHALLDWCIALQVEFKLSLNTEMGGFNWFCFFELNYFCAIAGI